MMPVSNRPVPDGYTEEWNNEDWSIGFVFQWSDFYEGWLDCEVALTVKPGQTLSEAFEDHMEFPIWNEYTIFFSNEG